MQRNFHCPRKRCSDIESYISSCLLLVCIGGHIRPYRYYRSNHQRLKIEKDLFLATNPARHTKFYLLFVNSKHCLSKSSGYFKVWCSTWFGLNLMWFDLHFNDTREKKRLYQRSEAWKTFVCPFHSEFNFRLTIFGFQLNRTIDRNMYILTFLIELNFRIVCWTLLLLLLRLWHLLVRSQFENWHIYMQKMSQDLFVWAPSRAYGIILI